MEIRFCYQVLELSAGISQSELKQAYKDLVQVWHPDRFSHNPRLQAKAAQKLVQINEAYETLGHALKERDRLQSQFAQAEAARSADSSRASTASQSASQSASEPSAERTSTATGPAAAQPGNSTGPGSAASAQSSYQSGQRAKGRAYARERYAAYRGYNYRRSFAVRWFFSAIAMSFGVILLMFTPFVIAYAIAQQPGLFLLPAVALVGVYGYRVLRIN